jgi:serine/threonine protein kinase
MRQRSLGRAAPRGAPVTTPAFGMPRAHITDPAGNFQRTEKLLGHRFRLDAIAAVSRERVLFRAQDLTLKRQVSLRVNFFSDEATRAWFLREAEALAQLDHPAIRHIYDAGVIDDLAYRVGNWIDGEGLDEAVLRGPRLIPTVHALARDLLGALDHAHASGIVLRRIAPASLLIGSSGRGTVTDARFSSWTLPAVPADVAPTEQTFMAPEVRSGAVGDPTSDIYTAGAILYFASTGHAPPLDTRELQPPTELRPTLSRAVERVIMRALRPLPDDRYLNAAEMLEDFASDAGTFEAPAAVAPPLRAVDAEDKARWEKRLRRALGDDYELLSPLGSGGFGRVYRVRDLHLEREVALKALHPLLTRDLAVVERFRREAQLAARLNHINIVNIYDIGGRSGLIWYTMELIDGPSLAQLVERDGPLPLSRVLRLMREALSALAHAHGSGLVHRDIKPENMLVERDGGLRITDFGLALALRGRGKFGGATSRSGTPQFASPEQLLGEHVDQRSDLYSLAAVAYFLLLGQPPFRSGTPQQVLALQTTNQLPPLAERRDDVSEELERVLRRALRPEAEDRYPSAAEFLQALNRASGTAERNTDWTRAAARWLRFPPSGE